LLINSVDIDGVAIAGVQALAQRTTDLKAENEALRAEVAALRALLAERDGTLAALQAETAALHTRYAADSAALDERLVRLERMLLQAAHTPPSPRPDGE